MRERRGEIDSVRERERHREKERMREGVREGGGERKIGSEKVRETNKMLFQQRD